MGRVVIAAVDDASEVEFAPPHGVRTEGAIRTRAVIGGTDRPLVLWKHEMEPGAAISWDNASVGHVAYVLTGTVQAEGTIVAEDGAFIVEHGGRGILRAESNGASILHFHAGEGYPNHQSRAGGNVHVLAGDAIFRQPNADNTACMTVWADAKCPTCELWFHRRDATRAGPQGKRHFHDVDEIIYVLKGGMQLGKRTLPPGTALAIDADTIYAFGVAEGGLSFLNFRITEPGTVHVGPRNEPLNEMVKGADHVRGWFATARHGDN